MTDPYEHQGRGKPTVHEDWRPGLTCDLCDAFSMGKQMALRGNFDDNWAGLSFASVPGGNSGSRMGGLTPMESQKKFDGDLYAYEDAKKAGLQPDTSTKAGVEKAEKRAYSFDRVKGKADKGMYEISGDLKQTMEGAM